MQKIFFDSRILDKAARDAFGLTEDIMMENAAMALEKELKKDEAILIATGSGNNGGDGWALARRICSAGKKLTVLEALEAKSPACLLQKERALKCGVNVVKAKDAENFLDENGRDFDCVVDCVFGSGFHGEFADGIKCLMKKLNALECKKLACDIPSGLDSYGNAADDFFAADLTVTMGALKLALFSSTAKDACGKILVADLGIDRELFEGGAEECAMLLEEKDLTLPHRKKQNVNKGTFGHTAIVAGEKTGAALIASNAALRFGSGLVTLVAKDADKKNIPCELMASDDFPANTSAVGLGMGLGRKEEDSAAYLDFLEKNEDIPCLLDADIFYSPRIKSFLEKRSASGKNASLVLTPHPKEFSVLLENCGLGKYSTGEVCANAFELAKKFCASFPGAVLLLKGAVVLIAAKEDEDIRVYANPYGTQALAKGGSGDVLSGLVASLLAQGWSAKESAVNASLAHALASRLAPCDYALTPLELIRHVGEL
ncbi:MAG: NAD(P)H-hydrate dehydratase [Treponema sp.]|nr:NAD(P)H-hydrate dehydratase [Treponema sp.]